MLVAIKVSLSIMDFSEEQQQELEVLKSIYCNEFSVINADYPAMQFTVDIKLDLVGLDGFSLKSDSLNYEHHVLLKFELPERYPDVAPQLEIEPYSVSATQNDKEEEEKEDEVEFNQDGSLIEKVENLADSISFNDYVPELIVRVLSEVDTDMLLGTAMCFALISSVKEHCETWFQEQLKRLQKDYDRRMRESEMEEQRKFQGTKVTRDTYLAWRECFRKKHLLGERDHERRMKAHAGRLSGRQIFEQSFDGGNDELIDDDEELTNGMKQL